MKFEFTNKVLIILLFIFFGISMLEFGLLLNNNCSSNSVKSDSFPNSTPEKIVDNIKNEVFEKPSKKEEFVDTKIEETQIPNKKNENELIRMEISGKGNSEILPKQVNQQSFKEWESLKVGMTPSDVSAILGKPNFAQKGVSEIWKYKYSPNLIGDVVFYQGKVITWVSPKLAIED